MNIAIYLLLPLLGSFLGVILGLIFWYKILYSRGQEITPQRKTTSAKNYPDNAGIKGRLSSRFQELVSPSSESKEQKSSKWSETELASWLFGEESEEEAEV